MGANRRCQLECFLSFITSLKDVPLGILFSLLPLLHSLRKSLGLSEQLCHDIISVYEVIQLTYKLKSLLFVWVWRRVEKITQKPFDEWENVTFYITNDEKEVILWKRNRNRIPQVLLDHFPFRRTGSFILTSQSRLVSAFHSFIILRTCKLFLAVNLLHFF